MNSRERFLRACRNRPSDRPPIWVMRQAGRYLPEYRKLKNRYTFLEMVKNPEIACAITIQPMKRFPLDAAIIFSDILVIPEAMGLPYTFSNKGGILMAQAIDTEKKIASLSISDIAYKLKYVTTAIEQARLELGSDKALLGFSGSPWTLASYMVEGGSSKNFTNIKHMLYSRPDLFDSLLSKITRAVIDFLYALVEAGVDAVQIFDSWAGVLSEYNYWVASAKYITRIIHEFKGKVPVILYPKGAHYWIKLLKKTNADVIGLDWTVSIARFYDNLGGKYAVQGNLDPALLNTEPSIVKKETLRIINEFEQRGGHIFNLGHGILPDAKVGCMAALVDTVVRYAG